MSAPDPASFSNGESHGGEELWRHKSPESSQMYDFLKKVQAKHGLKSDAYKDLYDWSVESVSDFWGEVWDYVGVKASRPYDEVMSSETVMFPRPTFFGGARLNFAENLLYPPSNPDPTSPAILAATEITRETVSWASLRERVARCQAGLKQAGVGNGDRVAGYLGNHVDSIVAMLAATSLGAIWTAVSPDSGVSMVLDRLTQIRPIVLFVDATQYYNGKRFDVLPKAVEIVQKLESLKIVVVLPTVPGAFNVESLKPQFGNVVGFDEFQKPGLGDEPYFEQLPPDHPVYILYSSGTTGAPKCIIHGAIGTLIQHKKEHVLHCDIRPGERVFYFTTVTWMMWHWLVSGLAAGATLVLYDGSPMRYRSAESATDPSPSSVADDLAMPRLIDELGIQHFGTSAKYLSILEQKNVFPRSAPANLTLNTLKAIYNTASPLAPSTFRYVYKAFGPDIMLGSITGGTDIISLFGASCPVTPVYAGEVQVPGLGMAIRSYTDDGKDVTDTGTAGDLVCVKPFACQPVAFWPMGAGCEGEAKYKKSYFERFDGIWHHGDYVQFCPHPAGNGVFMLGRSDGVLNPAGIRFGSAEIYNVLLKHFPGKVADGLCIGRRKAGEADETVVLFVKMEEGLQFDEKLEKDIKVAVRGDLSARHVPGIIDVCPDIPVTVNGKKVEGAVKQIISGSTVKTSASVANATCLEFFRQWASSH